MTVRENKNDYDNDAGNENYDKDGIIVVFVCEVGVYMYIHCMYKCIYYCFNLFL